MQNNEWENYPPKMYPNEFGWYWAKDKINYQEACIVYLNCNEALKIGISYNELDDIPLDLQTAKFLRLIEPI